MAESTISGLNPAPSITDSALFAVDISLNGLSYRVPATVIVNYLTPFFVTNLTGDVTSVGNSTTIAALGSFAAAKGANTDLTSLGGITGNINLNSSPANLQGSGIISSFTAGQNLVFGDPTYVDSTGKMFKADMEFSAPASTHLCLGTYATNQTGNFLSYGYARNDSWSWTVGGLIYLSTTSTLTQTIPPGAADGRQVLGEATASNIIRFSPSPIIFTPTGYSVSISSSAAAARTALGAASSGLNSDITQLISLSTPLSIGQGGTAGTSQATAQSALNVPSTTGIGASGTWGIDISGNAATATVNANLTGVITSVGNATSIASQTGTGSKFVVDTSPTLVTPNIGTPSAGVLTNCSGTASALTAGHVTTNANLTGDVTSSGNATTLATVNLNVGTFGSASLVPSLTVNAKGLITAVTTNAVASTNLTGVITSVGAATSIASQTGTGTKFVVDTSPTLVTPNIGTPSAGVLTNCTGTASGLTAGNVTTNANSTGQVTSVGNVTTIAALGSFAAAKGANSDITSLDGVTGGVSTANSLSNKGASGRYIVLTAGESLSFGDIVYMNSDSKVYKADNSNAAKFPGQMISGGDVGATATGKFYLLGTASLNSWTWTAGGLLYLSTSGGMTQTAPTGSSRLQILGVAINPTLIIFQPSTSVNPNFYAASGANGDITSLSGLTGDIAGPTSVTVANNGALRTDTTVGHSAKYQAYDTTNSVYRTFISGTAGTTPAFAISQPTNGALTFDGGVIGGVTPSSGSFTALNATGQPNFSGATVIQKYVSANTSTAYALDAVNGTFFDLTLNGNCTITVTESIAANQSQFSSFKITQDGTGGRTLAFAGVTWLSGSPPVMPAAVGAYITGGLISINNVIYGYVQLQSTDSITLNALTLSTGLVGITSGSSKSAGYVGEVIQASVASGSAVSLTTATVTEITHIDLTSGLWMISANPTFLGTGITGTELQAFYSTASSTSTAGQDTYNTSYSDPFSATTTGRATASISGYILNLSGNGSIYLKAKATFTIGTCTAYGGITAVRIA